MSGLSLLQGVRGLSWGDSNGWDGGLLEVSSLPCVVSGWHDSEDGLSCGSQREHTDGLSVWLETLITAALFPEGAPENQTEAACFL